jgi:hypothetical protein
MSVLYNECMKLVAIFMLVPVLFDLISMMIPSAIQCFPFISGLRAHE